MGSRKQISVINVVMLLVHDIQLAKYEKKDTLILFINVKGAYNHVFINQLLKICQNLGLLRLLCNWIKCFINNRHLQLVFNENK